MSGAIVRAFGRHLVAPPALSDDEQAELLLGPNGALLVTSAGGLPVVSALADVDDSAGFVETRVVNVGAVTFSAMSVLNVTGGAARFIMIFDAAAVPAAGSVPDRMPAPLAAGGTTSLAPPDSAFTVGLVVVSSTTSATYTPSGTADLWITSYTYPP